MENTDKLYLVECLYRDILKDDDEEFENIYTHLWTNKQVSSDRMKNIMLDMLNGLDTTDSLGITWVKKHLDKMGKIDEDEEGEYIIIDGVKEKLKYIPGHRGYAKKGDKKVIQILEDDEKNDTEKIAALSTKDFLKGIKTLYTVVKEKNLTKSQLRVMNYIINNGKNPKGLNQLLLFITGCAGSDKSYLLNLIKNLYEYICKKSVKVTALTRAAAILIKGTTIHSAFKINEE